MTTCRQTGQPARPPQSPRRSGVPGPRRPRAVSAPILPGPEPDRSGMGAPEAARPQGRSANGTRAASGRTPRALPRHAVPLPSVVYPLRLSGSIQVIRGVKSVLPTSEHDERHTRFVGSRRNRQPSARRWRCCTNRHRPARCPPTGSSPADAIRHWSAEGGHPIQDLAAEDGLTFLVLATCPVHPHNKGFRLRAVSLC